MKQSSAVLLKARAAQSSTAIVHRRPRGSQDALCRVRQEQSPQAGLCPAGFCDCFLLAGRYTLLDQSALPEILPYCLERGISVVAGGPYNSGILAVGPREGATYNYRPADPAMMDKARRIAAVCARHGVDLRAAALQFVLAHPAIVSVIPGARSIAEVEENAALIERPIPAGLWADLKDAALLDPAAPTPGSER
jgi:D-threo-aldose 1-dehydrogenase